MYYPLTIFSLLLAAGGAILLWAVTASVRGLDLNTVGAILLVVGVIGFFLSLLPFWDVRRNRVYDRDNELF